jgi:hypothetical protein
MDQVHDTYNMIHACEVANEAEMAIGIRRASEFHELFDAALKESEGGNGEQYLGDHDMESDSALPSVIEISSGSIMEIESGSAPAPPLEPEPEGIDGV